MRKARGLICLILIAMTLLNGCMVLRETPADEGLKVPAARSELLLQPREIRSTLYFVEQQTGQLKGEYRTLVVPSSQTEQEVIVRAVLHGAFKAGFKRTAFAEFDRIEVMDNFANVYIKTRWTIAQEEKYSLAVQLAQSLIRSGGLEYVCVFFDGEMLNIDGYTVGAFNENDEAPGVLYDAYLAKVNASPALRPKIELYMPVYFADEELNYIMPEVRRITVDGVIENAAVFQKKLLDAVLNEAAAGPQRRSYLTASITSSARMLSSYYASYDEHCIYAAPNDNFLYNNCEADLAALYYNACTVIPELNRLKVHNVETGRYENFTEGQAVKFVGAAAVYYLPDEEGQIKEYVKVTKEVTAHDPVKFAEYYFKLLEQTELGRKAGIRADMLLSCYASDVTLVMNISSEFYDKLDGLSEKSARSVIYSIINTAGTMCSMKRTQLKKDGRFITETVGGVYVEYPLLPDYGLAGKR